MRMKMRKRKDRKVFARTARKVARANLAAGVYRGGIRL